MDGPGLVGAGALSTGQAVLFRCWQKDPDGQIVGFFTGGYKMGFVVGGAQDSVVTLRKGEDEYAVRREWIMTHPDMLLETRSSKIRAIGLCD